MRTRSWSAGLSLVLLASCTASAVNPSMVTFRQRRLARAATVTWDDVYAATVRIVVEAGIDNAITTVDDRAQVLRIGWFDVQERQGTIAKASGASDTTLIRFPRRHSLRVQWEYDDKVSFSIDCQERDEFEVWGPCPTGQRNESFVNTMAPLPEAIMKLATERAAARADGKTPLLE